MADANIFHYSEDSKHKIDSSSLGASSEMIACAFLLKNGYQVFRNVSASGSIDIMAKKKGIVRSFDVKTMTKNISSKSTNRVIYKKTKKQREEMVEILTVDINGNCHFESDVRRIFSEIRKRKRSISVVTMRQKTQYPIIKTCGFCHKEFTISAPHRLRKYCTPKCSLAFDRIRYKKQ